MSVSHSVHIGRGLPQCMLGYTTPPGQTPPGRHPPGRHPPGRHPPGKTPLGRHPLARPPPAKGHCCRRYTSYWNAFLFLRQTKKSQNLNKVTLPVFIRTFLKSFKRKLYLCSHININSTFLIGTLNEIDQFGNINHLLKCCSVLRAWLL